MGRSEYKQKCAFCSNDGRFPHLLKKKRHVLTPRISWYQAGRNKLNQWQNAINNVLGDKETYLLCQSTKICSNHFLDGYPNRCNPDPVLFLTNKADVEQVSANVYIYYYLII